ncbi:toll/interleukin-1 receptor domain-containing protein [Leptospira kirschneri]|uniref:toll/interleukin-1 receptor domain-containing protein n=1 Tax=Leptospira kirschneri TaxID=29507 RepID=UPI001E43AA34|nr:toll/interleukin-1 receptor domain-containing protein [Leptospira kirschneri]
MNPKVFISHASEDKDRFVINFSTKLRSKGIDAWLDKWEMRPGDRIFEEGIKNADAFIIVLSKNSVNKPWVREELM